MAYHICMPFLLIMLPELLYLTVLPFDFDSNYYLQQRKLSKSTTYFNEYDRLL
nr:hypothetical protein Iba_chr12eCG10490 [Ipomoea batatas]